MSQHIPGSISSGCYVSSHTSPHGGLQNPSSPNTSNPNDVSQRRIVGNCQSFALSLLRSVKNITSRVDHGVTRTPGRRTLVATRGPVTFYPNLLLLAALVAVFGLVIKLGLDD
ncbi:hypothetical protein GDO81_011071 [Engystomops pustulosus]|uniref:Uncharacterized protein n=1 Tax=Engystomops pustulosus TaxID=76066 RepID=A0AAV7C4C6_ENGPU|nr:hypothetical protein GDO81_011071 [Engystomops pustulosus]